MRLRPGQIAQAGATSGQALVWNGTEWAPAAAGGGSLTVQDENSNVSTSVTQIDFQGAGVTATSGTGEVVVTIPGGSSSPTTTKGDLIVRSATADDRLAVGTDGYSLVADSSQTLGVRYAQAYPTPIQETFTATGGETTLTLGATPIGGVVLLWKNGTLLWVTTNYTISGTTVTFTTALTAGDVIRLQYSAAGTSPPPSSLGGVSGSPAGYAGLQVWYRPEAISGVLNGDPLASWPDASGNGNDMAASGTARPMWMSAPFVDGKGGVRFTNATAQYMQLASATAVDLTGDFAIFAVVRFTTVNKGSTVQNTVISKDYTRYELYEYQTMEASYIGGTANPANSASSTLAASAVYLLELHRASSAVTLIKNAVQVGSATNSASATGTYNLTLGNRGSSLTTGNGLNGDLLEVFVYNQARSSTEKTALRNYVGGRWPSIGL